MSEDDAQRAVRAVFRAESARLVARIARIVRDVGVAEELAQDALVAALDQWSRTGVPENPAAWLMGAAKNRAINVVRRRAMLDRKHAEVARELDAAPDAAARDFEAAMDDDIGDDWLRLVFTACHPALAVEGRVALTLRLLGGLTTGEIARAFLVGEPTVAQRLVRAKRTLAERQVPYAVPREDELGERLGSVLTVVYLIFNEGYAATAGDDYMRPELCADAMRLGATLAALLPREPEVHGLAALMALTASRAAARVGPSGEPVLLADQDRNAWDRARIDAGLASLARAESLAPSRGPYALQAAIAACHARAASFDATDWRAIASLYGELAAVAPSPVVALNRAVAVGRAAGPEAGLALLAPLADEPSLRAYHRVAAARGDLLERAGRHDEARAEFARAASLTKNTRERDVLLARAERCGGTRRS